MSKTVKWILGIAGVLVILAIIAGGAWVFGHRAQLMANNAPYAAQPRAQNQQPYQQFGPRGFNDGGRGPMNGWGMGPMMRGRAGFGRGGGFRMFFLGGFFMLIVPLFVLAAVAFLFYQLGRRSSTHVVRQDVTSAPPSNPNPPQSE